MNCQHFHTLAKDLNVFSFSLFYIFIIAVFNTLHLKSNERESLTRLIKGNF